MSEPVNVYKIPCDSNVAVEVLGKIFSSVYTSLVKESPWDAEKRATDAVRIFAESITPDVEE